MWHWASMLFSNIVNNGLSDLMILGCNFNIGKSVFPGVKRTSAPGGGTSGESMFSKIPRVLGLPTLPTVPAVYNTDAQLIPFYRAQEQDLLFDINDAVWNGYIEYALKKLVVYILTHDELWPIGSDVGRDPQLLVTVSRLLYLNAAKKFLGIPDPVSESWLGIHIEGLSFNVTEEEIFAE